MSAQRPVRVDEADAYPQSLDQITPAVAFTVSRCWLGPAPAGARSAELMVGDNSLRLSSSLKEQHQLIGEFVQASCRT
jgi:hypothetical protein